MGLTVLCVGMCFCGVWVDRGSRQGDFEEWRNALVQVRVFLKLVVMHSYKYCCLYLQTHPPGLGLSRSAIMLHRLKWFLPALSGST